ncbi:hypothetical protein [Peterkaempfera griseoplana]|uniref:hypothetical protein n=1 Tax=Peterkaempfera griseoplana TaxID=66896 RepID=UPI0006E3904B|nr:hypothetical protein [Peterkaempfera griseoplana]
MSGSTTWSFGVDEDEAVIPAAPAGTPENLRLAVETLIDPFGLSADATRDYLREWRRMADRFGAGYVLGTPSASVRRTGPGEVEIGDLYGQFQTCRMDAAAFEELLEALIAFLDRS